MSVGIISSDGSYDRGIVISTGYESSLLEFTIGLLSFTNCKNLLCNATTVDKLISVDIFFYL